MINYGERGLPLNDSSALTPSHWSNQGLLGDILMEIRDNSNNTSV